MKTQKVKVIIEKDKTSIVEFIEAVKRDRFTKKDANIPKEYIVKYVFTENINELNDSIEVYHFGITN